ncbi:MAG TPA: protocatechuate 3,4-dioxygenase subunit alpha [Pseudonocardia sp.]
MPEPLEPSAPSPGQTVGPFFHDALPYPGDRELVPPGTPGAVLLHGHVRDGEGAGLPDALVEIRQADATGAVPRVAGSLHRPGAPFTGWGRSDTDRTGRFWFRTVEPAPTRDGGAAFLAVAVFARGLLDVLFTRVYLPADTADRAAALAADPLLARLDPDRRARLTAVREPDGNLRFDVHLQGPRESVFLSYPRHR